MAEAGLPAPEYRQNEFMVYATIRQAKDAAGQVAGNSDVNGGLNGGLNESQKMTLEYIRRHEGCQVKKISADLNVPVDTIDKHISVLVNNNMIERRGSKKTGGYYVKK